MHPNVYYILYSQFSRQHFSAAIAAIFWVILLKEYKCVMSLVVLSSLHKH
jgi:hypothetical protein